MRISLGGHKDLHGGLLIPTLAPTRHRLSWSMRLRRFIYELCPMRNLYGVEVRVLMPDRGEFEIASSKIRDALELIATYDARRFGRLTRDVRRIWVGPTASQAEWFVELEMCVLRFEHVLSPDTSAARLALTLAHEATHARLDRGSFGYEEERRVRIERICVNQEIALAERLPDGSSLAADARSRLSYGPEIFTDAAMRARADRLLRSMGWVGRVGGAIGRAIAWFDRRRAA
jgi:hypothetical protein